MEQPTLIGTKEFVRDLVDGQAVDSVFEVRALTRRQKKNGEAFLKLQLGDATGISSIAVTPTCATSRRFAIPPSNVTSRENLLPSRS